MKILIIGSGGREHAIAWKLHTNPKIKKIYVAQGNSGIQFLKKCECLNLFSKEELLKFALRKKIDLTIVGPEQLLIEGIVDLFHQNNLKIFGPNKIAAQLEGSKIFSKNFMQEFNIPTAQYKTFTNFEDASNYINTCNYPIVIKIDALAAGKGVDICQNIEQAKKTLDNFIKQNVFKHKNPSVVIEEYLEGKEASIICITDGLTMKPLLSAKDYKTINEGNIGPNTGGMGAICPNPYVKRHVMKDFIKNIMNNTMKGICAKKINYVGFLFFGVMITKDGCKLLEYNVRMGDPECQSIMPMIKFNLLDLFLACFDKRLNNFKLLWEKGTTINVVLASDGYPTKYEINKEVKILGDCLIFFAGCRNINDKIITTGGRVLSVVYKSYNLHTAIKHVYKEVDNIQFENKYFRKDIGS